MIQSLVDVITNAPVKTSLHSFSPQDVPAAVAAGAAPAVTPTLVADQVFAYLEGEILTGRFPGGMRLRVRQLAELTGTSVMPVRDAISRLEEAGIVVRAPHKGAVVKEFSISELIDIYAVRTLLEEAAAQEGARRVTDDDLAAMERSLAEMNTALTEGRIGDAMAADSQMLRILYRAGGNDLLCNLIEALWKQCHYYRIMAATTAYEQNDDSLWEPERQIFLAARDRNAPAAAKFTRVSLESATNALRSREQGLTAGP